MNEVTHTPFDFFLPFYWILMTCVFAVTRIRGTSTITMERLGLDLDLDQQQEQDNRKERPQLTAQVEERRLKFQRCIESFVHATNYPEVKCPLPKYTKMKRVVKHAEICKRKTAGSCGVSEELVHLVCYHAKHCQQRECTVQFCRHIKHKLRPQRTQQRFAQTQTLRRRMSTTQRQSMQPQPQMPGQSMPSTVGVAAGMGQSHQTLQPQQQLPPYLQSVMPQKPEISGPLPRAVEEAQKIAQAVTMQAAGSGVPIGRRVPQPQQGFPQQQPHNMAHRLDPWGLLW